MEDLSVFYEYYISETRQAKRDLYHLKYATQNEEHINLTHIDPEQEVFEKAFHTIWGEQDFLTPYPYPKDLNSEVIKQIFKQKGIIIYKDIGHYLRVTRTSSGQVMEDVEDFTGISHPTLSRIERGQSTRIRFEDIIAIDDFFKAGGTIAGMFWRAAEFHTGVLLNKSLADGKSKPPIEWGQLRRRIADVIIMIHRLQKSYFNDDNNWLNELRLRLKPYYLNIATKFYEEATFEDELDPNIDKGELYKRTTRFVRQYLASQYLQNTSTSLQITIERGQTLWSFIKRHLSTSDYKDFFQLTLEDLELSPNSATLDGINYLIKKLIQNDDSFASELHRLLAKLTANTNI
jgi:transcriptional regulator with XRE-family HTH domain